MTIFGDTMNTTTGWPCSALKNTCFYQGIQPREKQRESLEGIAQTAKETDLEREQRIEEIRMTPLPELDNQVRAIDEEIRKTGIETAYQQNKIEEIHEGIYRKKQDVEENKYVVGEREEELMTTVAQTLKKFYERR